MIDFNKRTLMNSSNTANATRTLKIDGMSGDECVTKATGALKNVSGVKTESVDVGTATIVADQGGCESACKALGAAGYPARESQNAGGADRSGGEQRGENQQNAGGQQRSGGQQGSGGEQRAGGQQGSGGEQRSGSQQGSAGDQRSSGEGKSRSGDQGMGSQNAPSKNTDKSMDNAGSGAGAARKH